MANATFFTRFAVGVIAMLLLVSSGCRPDDGGTVRINPKVFDANDEESIGKRLVREQWRDETLAIIKADQNSFTDGTYDYLRPLLEGVVEQAAVSRRDSFAWQVVVVLDDTPHAYTLPGGRIVLHSGLLHSLHDEAECVGLLAREVALAETGAAMAALDRQVEDNVTLGDLILGNLVPLDHVVEALPRLAYTAKEVAVADSVAALLVCPSDYDEVALLRAVDRLDPQSRYIQARPTSSDSAWGPTFSTRVADCPGADSLYAVRYREVLRKHLP